MPRRAQRQGGDRVRSLTQGWSFAINQMYHFTSFFVNILDVVFTSGCL
jgi:hypothetical protein